MFSNGLLHMDTLVLADQLCTETQCHRDNQPWVMAYMDGKRERESQELSVYFEDNESHHQHVRVFNDCCWKLKEIESPQYSPLYS